MSTPSKPVYPSNNNNDADLEDLLQEDNHHGTTPLRKQHHLEMTPLNLDHLTKGQLDVSTVKPSSPSNGSSYGDICSFLQGTCSYIAYAHPRVCCCCALGMIVFVLVMIATTIMNPTIVYGNVHEDFSNVQSQFDLSLGSIDHWCLRGDNDSCRCEDPLVPTPRGEFQTWTKAHVANKKLLEDVKGEDIKCAFVGESLVEEMDGRWMGQSKGPQLKTMHTMFQQTFSSENNVQAVALGIAGDTVSKRVCNVCVCIVCTSSLYSLVVSQCSLEVDAW